MSWNKGNKNPMWGKLQSEETRRKIGLAHMGKIVSEETKKKLSKSGMGRKISKETRAKMAAWQKGRSRNLSKETRRKIGDSSRKRNGGDKNPNWKGGITPLIRRIRNSREYQLWRKICLERDNFTCQKYGISGGVLIIHHINNFKDFPELRFAIDNGVTLSEKAHKEFHKEYGKRNNTREQLLEFLTKIRE